jgi:Tfp pilus assembly protein PilF
MASESYSQSPAILHNLGVCSEIKNQLTEAASLYQQAEGLLLKPNKTISSALVRVSNRVSQQEQVAKQMR